MNARETAAREGAQARGEVVSDRNADTVSHGQSAGKPAPKWWRTLRALRTRPHLHRFQAERDPEVRDHTLPSTVADLERKGLRIDRRIVKLRGFAGSDALVAEYHLAPDQYELADRLLEAARGTRRASP